jgi:hypothetical protein
MRRRWGIRWWKRGAEIYGERDFSGQTVLPLQAKEGFEFRRADASAGVSVGRLDSSDRWGRCRWPGAGSYFRMVGGFRILDGSRHAE